MKQQILIIDDDLIYRKIIRKILCGIYNVILSESFEEASQYINNELDLIIADLNLPEIEGEELIKRIQGNIKDKEIPIMVISGMDDDELKLKLFDLGISEFLTKPIDRNVLKEKIADVIGSQII